MKTPICDFVEQYAAEDNLRLHMPGHKGFGETERRDITEIEGADVLYQASSIIAESQQNAAELFGTAKTLYSCEGSSLSIRAMLYLARLHAADKGNAPKILAGRNAHKTFVSAAALLDIEVEWLRGESLLSCFITADRLRAAIAKHNPSAVYVTSPDYLGNRVDIKALSEVCKESGVLLLVDNAHGAYLQFLSESRHPIALGADICCDSAHKTLPVLTGGGYLHISKNAPQELCRQAEKAMALFASTSPSYLILQSLDKANAYLADGYAARLESFAKQKKEVCAILKEQGIQTVGNEPLKLTLAPKSYGYDGDEISDYLRLNNVIVEYYDPDHTVLMFTPEQTKGLKLVQYLLSRLPRLESIDLLPPTMAAPEKVLGMKEALFAPSQKMAVEDCNGKVLGALSVSCPPAVSAVVCGERIDRDAIEVMKYYGITECEIIK